LGSCPIDATREDRCRRAVRKPELFLVEQGILSQQQGILSIKTEIIAG